MTQMPDKTPHTTSVDRRTERKTARADRRARQSEHRAHRAALRHVTRRADLAVAYLFCRRLFPTLPIILVALTAVQTALFALALRVATPAPDSSDRMISFDLLCERSGLGWIFAVAFTALTIALASLPDRGTNQSAYTLARLGISDRSVALHHALAALGTYLALWAVEIVTVFAFSAWYTSAVADTVIAPLGQSLYLAAVSDPFLHSLLPLRDVTRFYATGFTILILSLAVANIGICRRHNWKSWISFIAIPTLAVLFVREPDRWDMDFLCVIPLCLLFGILILRVWKKGVDPREKDPS